MGICFSCCARRSRDERQPLLPQSRARTENNKSLGRTHDTQLITKIADVLGALRAGKLPSQDQINAALRKLLRSDMLAVDPPPEGVRRGRGASLSARGKVILEDIREVIEAVVQFGMEKNDDDTIQDLIYRNAQMGGAPVTVEGPIKKTGGEMDDLASAIPSSSSSLETDTHHLSHTLLTLSRLLLTSNTFRLVLSDIFLASRELLAGTAAGVGRVACVVEGTADAVEEAVKPRDGDDYDDGDADGEDKSDALVDVKQAVRPGAEVLEEEQKSEWEKLGDSTPDRVKEVGLERLQSAISQAQQTPAYKGALNTLLLLLRKYVKKTRTAAAISSIPSTSTNTSASVAVHTDPNLTPALQDLRTILERLASGRPLDDLIRSAKDTIRAVVSEPAPSSSSSSSSSSFSTGFKKDLRNYCEEVGEWLDRALSDRSGSFVSSAEGQRDMDRLYTRGRDLIRSEEEEENVPWVTDARKFLDELDAFVHALASDKTTRRITDSLEKLSAHTAEFTQAAVVGASLRQRKTWQEEAKRDLLGWIIPRALNMLKVVPLPRVEMKSGPWELAVDSILLRAVSASFVPDHVVVQNWSEIRVDASAAAPDASGDGGVATFTKTRIHIDGLRVSAHGLGYYVKRTTRLFGGLVSWEDSGILSVDVGACNAPGKGLAVDIEIETTPSDDDPSSIFTVNDIKVDAPGLTFTIDRSRHWIINKLLLQPLAAPYCRRILQTAIASHLRKALENLNETMCATRMRAQERVGGKDDDEGPTWEDYWQAVLETVGSSWVETEEEDEAGPVVETNTRVTPKGVIWSSITQPDPEGSNPPTPSETIVAVGVGTQILPSKGGPERDIEPVAEQALTDMEEAAGNAVRKGKEVRRDVMVTAVKAREELEEVSERMEKREGVERRRKGWRSRVFDFVESS